MSALPSKPDPKFDNPPVVEVYATAQFSELEDKDFLLQMNSLWESIGKKEYPELLLKNKQQPLSNVHNAPQLEFIDGDSDFHYPRIWLESADKFYVIQIQADRLSFSWRKISSETEQNYPSYDVVWEKFSSVLNMLSKFSQDTCGKSLEINFLELAYINAIKFDNFGGAENIHTCIPSITSKQIPDYLGSPDTVNFLWETPTTDKNVKFRIQGLTGADRSTGEKLLRLDLTQRGAVDFVFDKDSQKIHTWFEKAHSRIVHTFKDITSNSMHVEKWGIQ